MSPLSNETVLAIRDECLAVSTQAIALFDSLEDGTLTIAGAEAAVAMYGHAAGVRQALTVLAAAAVTQRRPMSAL